MPARTPSSSRTTAGASSTGAPTPLEQLPAIAAAVGDRAEVYVDGGIMSGGDVIAAVAMGARAVLVGRAYLYGLMAGGERGVARAGEMLRKEAVRTMQLLGVPSDRRARPRARPPARPLTGRRTRRPAGANGPTARRAASGPAREKGPFGTSALLRCGRSIGSAIDVSDETYQGWSGARPGPVGWR